MNLGDYLAFTVTCGRTKTENQKPDLAIMMVLSSCLIALAVALQVVATLATSVSIPPTFDVNLDLPPQQRWRGSVQTVLAKWPFAESFEPVFTDRSGIYSVFSQLSTEQIANIAQAFKAYYPENAAEVQGIADDFAASGYSNVTFEFLSVWVYWHELAHCDPQVQQNIVKTCTGVLVQQPNMGSVLHGRHMDNTPAPYLRRITLRTRFFKAGQVVFEGVDW